MIVKTARTGDTCENCGRAIGKLETPQIDQEHVVCMECKRKLVADKKDSAIRETTLHYGGPVKTATTPAPQTAYAGYAATGPRPCPGCGCLAAPVKKAKGNIGLAILLLLLWILPGVIYLIMCNGYIYVCPNCGMKLGDAT